MRTLKEIRSEIRELRADMKARGISARSFMNRQPDQESARCNERLFALNCELEKAVFDQALQEVPACVDPKLLEMRTDPGKGRTLSDLRWGCAAQLDLMNQVPGGTEGDDPEAIRRWLKKYGRPQRKS